MDSLNSILSRRDFDTPPEVIAIQDYVRRHYDTEVGVRVDQHTIVVSSPSSALMGTLRLNLPKLQKAAGTDKRIQLRTSSR